MQNSAKKLKKKDYIKNITLYLVLLKLFRLDKL